MPHLIWKRQERRAVMSEALRIIAHEDSNLRQRDLLFRAQKVLPPERQNRNPSGGLMSQLFQNMRKLEASGHIKANEHPPKVQHEHSPAPMLPATPMPGLAADGPEIITVERRIVVKQFPDYGKIPTLELARVLLERLDHLEQVEDNMRSLVQSLDGKRASEAVYHRRLDVRPVEKQPEPEPLRICVIGLLPEQQHEVEKQTASVPKPVKLRFYDSGHGVQELPMKVDYIIAARFVRHSWWDKAKATLSSDCIFFIDGGVGSIVQKIYDLCSLQTVANGKH